MKHIKRFNERLDPYTYIRAGRMLANRPGGGKRPGPLIDYGLEKKFGKFYRMHWGNSSVLVGKDCTFTNLRCDSYFSRPIGGVQSTYLYSAEDVVERWANEAEPLCITFIFRFQATEETKDKIKHDELNKIDLPMFSFEVRFSNFSDGLDDFNEYIVEDEPVDVNGMYKGTKEINIYKKKPVKINFNATYPYFGIFADRPSALMFKRQLNKLIEPHKEKVMELLSCVNASGEDLDRFDDAINGISINELYTLDTDPRNIDKWFTSNRIN